MSSVTYPGLPTIARRYWRAYSYAVFGMGALVLFTGAAGALVVLTFLPAAKWYFAIAAVSFVLHTAAMFVRDVWEGDYEPSQSTFSTVTQLLVVVVVLGAVESAVLLIAAVGGYALASLLGGPTVVAAAVAAYYPVLDLVLMRRGKWYTPGGIVSLIVTTVAATLFNIHQSIIEVVPVVGKRRRPQS